MVWGGERSGDSGESSIKLNLFNLIWRNKNEKFKVIWEIFLVVEINFCNLKEILSWRGYKY